VQKVESRHDGEGSLVVVYFLLSVVLLSRRAEAALKSLAEAETVSGPRTVASAPPARAKTLDHVHPRGRVTLPSPS